MSQSSPNVYEYLDARKYLGDYYAHQKETTRSFSYRAFSKRAGLGSPNYLKMVIDGQRNLTPEMAERFGAALGLSGQRLAYFLDLVGFTQAKTTDERSQRYDRLLRFRGYREVHKIDVAYGEYHRHWYYPAIRELTFRKSCPDDPAWIAQELVPAVRVNQAKDAIELLMALGLIDTHEGQLVPNETLITTGPEVRGIHYVQYHQMMIEQGKRALSDITSKQRDISSVTICMGELAIERLKPIVARFRRELLQLSADEDEPLQVVQVNIQLFPLSQGSPTAPEES